MPSSNILTEDLDVRLMPPHIGDDLLHAERLGYSHIRMEAKRNALESLVQIRAAAAAEEKASQQCAESPGITQDFEGEYPQKSPESGILEDHRGVYRIRKLLISNGGRGRNRTYNLSVKSRMLCQLSYASGWVGRLFC